MKKRYPILIFVMLFSISGCQRHDTKVIEENKPYLLFVAPLEEHPLWLQTKDGFLKACEQNDYHCDWIGPKNMDTEKMNEVMKTGILQKADGIITQGVVSEALINQAIEAKIPVVLVDSDMPTSKRTAYFGKNFHDQAQRLLTDIQKKQDENQKLMIAIQVSEITFDIAIQQVQQVEEVFKDYPGGYEIVEITSSKSDQVRAKQEWARVFYHHPEINISLNFAGECVAACYESAINAGMRDQMFIYGVDDMEQTIQLLKEDRIDGSIITSFHGYGYDAVMFLKKYFDSEKQEAEKLHPAHLQLVTPENIEDYLHETSR